MVKISNSLFCYIILIFFIVGCKDNNIIGSPVPPTFNISNLFKLPYSTEKDVKIKLYQKKETGLNNVDYTFSRENMFIGSNNSIVDFKVKKNENIRFNIEFLPYEKKEDNIGERLNFVYELYLDDNLFMKKNIFITAKYICSKAKGATFGEWLLKTEELRVENNDYVKELKKYERSIKLEF
ncbi:MAG: hypothetical protein ACWIPJ_11440 [Polaribacter sp.]